MHGGLAYLNDRTQAQSLAWRNEPRERYCYVWGMAPPRHAWHLKAWLKAAEKKQADLERDLGMNKAKASLLARGLQPYDQDDISAIAEYLGIEPFELLMHPSEALAIRRFRASAEQIVNPEEAPLQDEFTELRVAKLRKGDPARRTGTYD
jgi:transcriptional regulator with XRE-family HTH domain